MRRPVQIALAAVLLTLALAACSGAEPSSSAVSPSVSATPAATPEVTICDQLGAVTKLIKDADTGAFTADELIPRALELRDWFWEQAQQLKQSGEDYIVDPKAYTGERTASHKLKFLGDLLGQWANGQTTILSVDVFASQDVTNFDC